MDNFNLKKYLVENKVTKQSNLNEGLAAFEFADILATHMQKYLPKDRWTVSYKDGEITVENDFNEVAVFRIFSYNDEMI